MDLFSDLNDNQRVAVETIDGPCLVIAGAGSGKTRVLTYRIAYLLSKGVPAWNILALTFTNKAAAEMKERIAHLVGEENARGLYMGTFHSIFARILRIESSALNGYDSNYTIYDADDAKKQIAKVVLDMNLDKDKYKAGKVAALISKAKNDLIPPELYKESEMWVVDKINRMESMPEIYARYTQACRASNAMDFDDLLLLTNILFRNHPEILQKYQQLFKYILVDEYQDTNSCQYHIIKKLALPENNLCVVGDDAQSIYSFRGAKIENILSFSRDYPTYKLFKLEQNYRSTQMIVNAANSVIQKNNKQIKKTTFSKNKEGEKIELMQCSTDADEGLRVATKIARMVDNGAKYSDFAILYRANSQSRILEEYLNKKRIPCKIVKGMSFFQRKEVKDVLSYVRFVINPKDEVALTRIINYPARTIGDATVEKIVTVAQKNNVSMWEVICRIEETGNFFSSPVKAKIAAFANLIHEFMQDESSVDAYSLMNRMVEKIGFQAALEHECLKEEAQERFANILELLNGAKEFVENEIDIDGIYLHNYIEKIALMTDMDEDNTDNPNKVMLMTVHASKGLEFKHCILVGLEENLFPSSMSLESQQNIEEERRLFYVALTRAMETATLSFANSRRLYGQMNNSTPSRFLSEIDSSYLSTPFNRNMGGTSSSFGTYYGINSSFSGGMQRQQDGAFSTYKNETREYSSSFSGAKTTRGAFSNYEKSKQTQPFVPSNPDDVKTGCRIYHERFGFGNVIERTGEGPNAAAIVAFENWGTKKLMLKFAKVQVVG